ncbi:MAG: hypothetical protein P4L33_19555 [Capsulimonadaceae bacterium]|nr:hypothetical protein [Capsulimonadaceae bacterium]
MIQRLSAAITVLVFAVLLALPGTRWVVQEEFEALAGRWTDEPAVSLIDHHRRNDFDKELAIANRQAAVARHENGNKLVRDDGVDIGAHVIDDLAKRYPAQPACYGLAARMAMLETIHLDRPEEAVLYSPSAIPFTPLPQSRNALNLFLKDVECGRKLEPDNGYFAILDAAGLLQAHRDLEALAALHHAGQCHSFNEHYYELFAGYDALSRDAIGRDEAIGRLLRFGRDSSPDFRTVRAAARIATGMAARAEMRGNARYGIRLRRDVRNVGALMRLRSHSFLCAMVGCSIIEISLSRPMGVHHNLTGDGPAKDRMMAHFCANLMRNSGFDADAASVVQQTELNIRTRAIIHKVVDRILLPVGILSAWYELSAIMLLAGLCVVASALLSGVVGLYPSIRRREPLSIAVWCGASIALPEVALCTLGLWALRDASNVEAFALVAVLALGVFALFAWITTRFRANLLFHYTIALFSSGCAIIVLICLAATLTELFRNMGLPFSMLISQVQPIHEEPLGLLATLNNTLSFGSGISTLRSFEESGLLVLLCASLPLVIATVAAIVALVRRRPMAASIVRAVSAAGPVVLCVLTLAYATLMIPILHYNAVANRTIDRIAVDEPGYYASLVGTTWPGR